MIRKSENEEAQRLAREFAASTGKSQVGAPRERLDRLEDHSPADSVARLLRLGRDCARRLREPYRSVDHGHLLYDDYGLPR